jgi:hypothetical protein
MFIRFSIVSKWRQNFDTPFPRELEDHGRRECICTSFIADYNRRFAKPPRNDFVATHRPVHSDEDLVAIFTWRERRKVRMC